MSINAYAWQRVKSRRPQFNRFYPTGLFLYPLKKIENLWFFYISEGVEKDQRYEMG